jgi:hypothetical protein
LRDTNYAVSWESRGSYKTQVRFRLHAYSPPAAMTHLGNALEPWKGTRMRFSGGMLHIANDGNVPASASIRLFDLQGRMLYQTQFRDARKCVIDLHRFGKGFRYVVISSGGNRYFEKINMSD